MDRMQPKSTGEMLAAIIRRMYLFLVVLTTIYAGELVWRERNSASPGITTNALPAPIAITLAGKFIALPRRDARRRAVHGHAGHARPCRPSRAITTTSSDSTPVAYSASRCQLCSRSRRSRCIGAHALVNLKFVGHVIMIVYFLVDARAEQPGLPTGDLSSTGFRPITCTPDMNQFRQYSTSLSGLALYFNAAIRN